MIYLLSISSDEKKMDYLKYLLSLDTYHDHDEYIFLIKSLIIK